MKDIAPQQTKIAWLGAGTMGAPMAGNLAKAERAFERVCQLGKGELGTQVVWMAHPARG